MSLSSGRNMLNGALKDLLVHWDETRRRWNDPMSQALEKLFLQPLEPQVRNAAGAMEEMSQLIAQIRKDCG